MNQEVNPYSPCTKLNLIEIEIGGRSKEELIKELNQHAIQRNPYAEQLLSSEHFTVSPTKQLLRIVKITVKELGFQHGANLLELYDKAKSQGLDLCPLELGPFLRLRYLHQEEGFLGHPQTKHQAPSGSLTIASNIIMDADNFPKGFYLRKIEGNLCLRGYCCSHDYVWDKDDCFVFLKK